MCCSVGKQELAATAAAPVFVAAQITDAKRLLMSERPGAGARHCFLRGVKVHLALGYTDMRKGIDGLAMLVQGVLRLDPFSGHLFPVPRSQGQPDQDCVLGWHCLCLFTKRLEQGVFLWPSNVEPGETLPLSSAQLSMLIDGLDWRAPERRWRPAVAG